MRLDPMRPLAKLRTEARAKPPAADDTAPADATAPAVQVPFVATLMQLVEHAATPAPTTAPVKSAAPHAVTATPVTLSLDKPTEPTATPSPVTPLEQAVHELLDRMMPHASEPELPHDDDAPAPTSLPAAPAPQVIETDDAAPAPAPAAPHALAEPAAIPAPTSHVHLVLDDGPDRVVMTVAVRGADVHVSLRTSDDQVAANLARNAATLDHALHARGLTLAELATETPPERQHNPRNPDEHRPDHDDDDAYDDYELVQREAR